MSIRVAVNGFGRIGRNVLRSALEGILSYTEEPLVSVDHVGNPASSVVDGSCTDVVDGRLVKVVSWYDNEWGYSCRVVDLVRRVGGRAP